MKKLSLIILLALLTVAGFSQENVVTISSGYSFANIEDTDVSADGWRINGSYEFNPAEGDVAYGISLGYINLKASSEAGISDTADYKIETMPIFFAPKYLFGKDKIKGFIKGAIGLQKSWLEREGPAIILEDNDWGFYAGFGAGANYFINEKLFLGLEYEIAWLTNSYYKDGWMNSAMLGIGMKF